MAFTCPRCGMTSHHPVDQAQGYCGSCHHFTVASEAELEAMAQSPLTERNWTVVRDLHERGWSVAKIAIFFGVYDQDIDIILKGGDHLQQ